MIHPLHRARVQIETPLDFLVVSDHAEFMGVVPKILQGDPLGLGHAVLCAKPVVGDDPFAVILADDLINCGGNCVLGQMLSVMNAVPTGLVQVLSGVPRTFLYALQAIKEQKEQAAN